MVDKALADALGDDTKIDELAKTLRAQAGETPKAAVQLVLGQDVVIASRARRLLSQLDEVAVESLLEPNPPQPEKRVELLQLAVDSEAALRDKVAARLEVLLDDKTPVPRRLIPKAEKQHPLRRVCDDAYVLLRRLIYFGEPDPYQPTNWFLNAPDDFKDEIIKRARATGVWDQNITVKEMDAYMESHPDDGGAPPPAQPARGLPPRR